MCGEKPLLFSNPTTEQGLAEIVRRIETQAMLLPGPHGQHKAETF
jgi:hypothetical protein